MTKRDRNFGAIVSNLTPNETHIGVTSPQQISDLLAFQAVFRNRILATNRVYVVQFGNPWIAETLGAFDSPRRFARWALRSGYVAPDVRRFVEEYAYE